MKRLTLQWNAVRDDGGQALTEFVIVIPIMLLFFFAMLQNFADFQASQLGNYAAFMAARVYSVDDAVDSGGSQQKALRAASWAMAPVASPVAGEFGMGMTGSTGLLGGHGILLCGELPLRIPAWGKRHELHGREPEAGEHDHRLSPAGLHTGIGRDVGPGVG